MDQKQADRLQLGRVLFKQLIGKFLRKSAFHTGFCQRNSSSAPHPASVRFQPTPTKSRTKTRVDRSCSEISPHRKHEIGTGSTDRPELPKTGGETCRIIAQKNWKMRHLSGIFTLYAEKLFKKGSSPESCTPTILSSRHTSRAPLPDPPKTRLRSLVLQIEHWVRFFTICNEILTRLKSECVSQLHMLCGAGCPTMWVANYHPRADSSHASK